MLASADLACSAPTVHKECLSLRDSIAPHGHGGAGIAEVASPMLGSTCVGVAGTMAKIKRFPRGKCDLVGVRFLANKLTKLSIKKRPFFRILSFKDNS